MKRFTLVVSTALAATLSWGSMHATQAATRFLDPSGSDAANDCTNSAAPCLTFSWAVSQASAGDTLSAAAGSYNESGIFVGKNLTINGAGQTTTFIDASGNSGPVLNFDSATVTVSNLTIENASQTDGCGGGVLNNVDAVATLSNVTVRHNTTDFGASGGGICNFGQMSLQNSLVGGADNATDGNMTLNDGDGGGIFNDGELVLDGTTVSGNSTETGGGCAGNAGGIFNGSGGTLTATNSSITGNVANQGDCSFGNDGNGGGIYNFLGTVTLDNSVVNNNQAMSIFFAPAVGGGGIFNAGGSVTIKNGSTISGNLAVNGPLGTATDGGLGGGIYHTIGLCEGGPCGNPNLDISNSTISGNTAFVDGGGIYRDNPMTLTNVTVSGNTALNGEGGGIYNEGMQGACLQPPCVGTLVNVTVAFNQALAVGGISGQDPNITTVVKNTLLAQNTQTSDNTATNCGPAGTVLSSQDYNLSDDDSCSTFLNQANDLNTTPAGIDPLANNGGNYPGNVPLTHALQATSKAVDWIPSANCSPLTEDERKFPRPGVGFGPNCDIGAFELQALPTPSPTPIPTPVPPATFLEGSGFHCSLNTAARSSHGFGLAALLAAPLLLISLLRKMKTFG